MAAKVRQTGPTESGELVVSQIEYMVGLSIATDQATFAVSPITIRDTAEGTKFIASEIVLGLSDEAVPLAEITNPGWALLVNHGYATTAGDVLVAASSGGTPLIRIPVGKHALIRLAATPWVKASAGNARLAYLICEA